MGLNFFSRNEIGTVLVRFAAHVLKDVGSSSDRLHRSAHSAATPSPLVSTIAPHLTGGNAPLRRRLTTREAMAHPVELGEALEAETAEPPPSLAAE